VSVAATAPARRLVMEWDDGSVHEFTREGDDAEAPWRLVHSPPSDVGDPLNVTGYDRFNILRVVANCLAGPS
jgi:hypothetical protein